ncbi:MAG: TonB-dependent receptor [Bacteroidetes bacterium]|nr:TonB-dependent receptor [Bacteroidota bacterium]
MKYTLDTDQKALEVNLDLGIYGTFAEIGAGQEVARYFFKVGAAAGTIAKTMSAYDKIYSDKIYGEEPSGRYVCEKRLYKMLDHEYSLLTERLGESKKETNFFVFADTIAALNFNRTIKGNGWLGLRFQLSPDQEPNELVLHVKMHDKNTQQQQRAIGVLGVNMVYACFRHSKDPKKLIISLLDHLKGRISIDMARLSGPDFDFDNRLLSYWLVKNQLSDAAIINKDGKNIHASEFLYKKPVMIVRGNFRPVTLVTEDLIKAAFDQFCSEEDVEEAKAHFLIEIIPDGAVSQDTFDDNKDFLERAKMLNHLGYSVIVSNCSEREKLVDYLSDYKISKIGIALGAKKLLSIIREKYQQNAEDNLLIEFGKLFRYKVSIYVYPALQKRSNELLKAANLPIDDGMKYLYQHLLYNRRLIDIKNYNPKTLGIFSKEVFRKLQEKDPSWKKMVPKEIVRVITEHNLLGYDE